MRRIPDPQMNSFAEDMVILYTNRCNIRCAHCKQESGPDQGGGMGPKTAKEFITSAARAGLKRIAISGGEPLLYWNECLDIISHTHVLGLESTVVTNAFWARSRAAALRRVRELERHGLTVLGISADTYHEEFLGPRVVPNAIQAAREIRLPVRIKLQRHETAFEEVLRKTCGPLFSDEEWEEAVQRIDTEPIGRGGRLVLLHAVNPLGPNDILSCVAGPSLEVTPTGRVYRCCNAIIMDRFDTADVNPFYFGNRRSFDVAEAAAKAEADVPYRIASGWNLLELAARLDATHYIRTRLEKGEYLHVCDVCLDICADGEALREIRRRMADPDLLARLRRKIHIAGRFREER